MSTANAHEIEGRKTEPVRDADTFSGEIDLPLQV